MDAIATARKLHYKQGWVWYQVRELKPNFIELCWLATVLGYKQSWALYKYAELHPALSLPTNKNIQPPSNLLPFRPKAQFSNEMEPDDRWIKVTDCISPPISQSLFRDQGRLVKFTGPLAVVAMKSEQLVPLAKTRLDKLSKAFQDVYGHEVHITLIADREQTSFDHLSFI